MHLKEGEKDSFHIVGFLTELVFTADLSSFEPTDHVGVGGRGTVQTVRRVSSPSVCAIWGLEESRLQGQGPSSLALSGLQLRVSLGGWAKASALVGGCGSPWL